MNDRTGHLRRQFSQVSAQQRQRLLGQRGRVIWLTGLSGAGKSSLAYALEARLCEAGQAGPAWCWMATTCTTGSAPTWIISPAGRRENLRRAADVARLFSESGTICIAALIPPLQTDNAMIRRIIGATHIE